MPTAIRFSTPPNFLFASTVLSHGWCELPPFSYDDVSRVLERVEKLTDGTIVRLLIGEGGKNASLKITVEGVDTLTTAQKAEIQRTVSTCLSIGRDLQPFYRALRGRPRYAWVERMSAGRLLLSPTVWEDLAKTLLTTNTTWNVTVQMCRRLADLGDIGPSGEHAFPTPAQVASLKIKDLTDQVRAGYRTEYLHEMATKIAERTIDVEGWRGNSLTTEDLYRQIKSLKGFGDYAVGSMLKLLGRFDRLGIDTGCRDVFRAQLNRGKPPSDERIRCYYEPFGEWRGLVMWMDVMGVNLQARIPLAKRPTV